MMKSNQIAIIDTSAIYALISSDDSSHKQAVDISKKLAEAKITLILPGDVFTETLNIIGKKLGRTKQLEVAKELTSGAFILVEANQEIRLASLDKLRIQASSTSYTDCVVMTFADQWGTKEIFGFDEVFFKKGYHFPTFDP